MTRAGRNSSSSLTGLKLIFRTVLVISCIAAFLILCWDQASYYLEKRTSVSQAFEVKERRAYPQIVICPKTPFTVKVVESTTVMYSMEEYLKIATNLTVRFMGRAFYDYVFDEELDYDAWDLPSYYHGLCRVFNVRMRFAMNEFMAFIVDQPVEVFFMEPGEEFFMKTVEFLNPVNLVTATTSVLIRVQPKVFRRFPDAGENCRKYNVSQFNKCIIDLFVEESGGVDNICSDVTSAPYFPGVKFCEPFEFNSTVSVTNKEKYYSVPNDTVQYNSPGYALGVATEYVARSLQGDAGACLRPCDTYTYELDKVPFLNLDEDSLGGLGIYLSFSSGHDEVDSEYLIHNFGSIVAAVGGAIGLFLGFSVLQLFSRTFDGIVDHYTGSRFARKTKVSSFVLAEATRPTKPLV